MLDSISMLWHISRDINRARRARASDKKQNEPLPASKPDTFSKQQAEPSKPVDKQPIKPNREVNFNHFMRLLEDLNNPF